MKYILTIFITRQRNDLSGRIMMAMSLLIGERIN